MSTVEQPFEVPTRPCILKHCAQKSAYHLYESHALFKLSIITALGGIAIGFVTVTLLNQFGTINAFNTATQWSLFGGGLFIGAVTLIGTYKYKTTKKYIRNLKYDSSNLDESYQFLHSISKWRSTIGKYGSGMRMRAHSKYHEWFDFVHPRQSEYDDYGDVPQVFMKSNPQIQVHWEVNGERRDQVIYKKVGTELNEIYRNSFEKGPKRYYYPFLQNDDVFIEDGNGHIVRVSIQSEEEESYHESQVVCAIASNEKVSSIRVCDEILLLGYKSGLLELIDSNTGIRISHLYANGEVLDAWIDPEEQQIVIFSNRTYTCVDMRRRKMEVWQF